LRQFSMLPPDTMVVDRVESDDVADIARAVRIHDADMVVVLDVKRLTLQALVAWGRDSNVEVLVYDYELVGIYTTRAEALAAAEEVGADIIYGRDDVWVVAKTVALRRVERVEVIGGTVATADDNVPLPELGDPWIRRLAEELLKYDGKLLAEFLESAREGVEVYDDGIAVIVETASAKYALDPDTGTLRRAIWADGRWCEFGSVTGAVYCGRRPNSNPA